MKALSISEQEIATLIFNKIPGILYNKRWDINVVKPNDLLDKDIRLTSVELAKLVTTLEFELDCNPFSESFAIRYFQTIDDVIKAYLDFCTNNQG